MRRMMLDIETLDTKVTAHVLSVGYAVFDEFKVYNTGEFVLCDQPTRTADAKTLEWWEKKGGLSLLLNSPNKVTPEFALQELSKIWYSLDCVEVWAQGSDFDLAILHNLWEGKVFWKFYQKRDLRTVLAIFGDKLESNNHSAKDDCLNQTMYLQKYLYLIGEIKDENKI